MLEQIWINMGVHFRFYRRHRLLLAFSAIYIISMLFSVHVSQLMATSTKQFTALKEVFSELIGFSALFTAGLGLVLISHHLGNRNLKMVLTKPCLPEVWFASGMVSIAVVSSLLHLLIFLSAALFSIIKNIPFQSGFLFVTINGFMESMSLCSFLMFLCLFMHPLIACILVVFLNEDMLYMTVNLTVSSYLYSVESTWKNVIKAVNYFVYMVVPMSSVVSGQTSKIEDTMKVSPGDWIDLGYTVGYTFAIGGLFYLLSIFLLKRKRLI